MGGSQGRRMRGGVRAVLGGSRGVLFGAVVAVVVSAGGIAWATIPDGTGAIHGCYDNSTGALRVIDPSKGQACASTETALNWGQKGIRWRGAWNSTLAYSAGDAVSYLGSSYYAKAASTAAAPNASPADWALLAAQGARGPQGPLGPNSVTNMGSYDTDIPPTNPSGTQWQFVMPTNGSLPQMNVADAAAAASVTATLQYQFAGDGTGENPATSRFGICYEPPGTNAVVPADYEVLTTFGSTNGFQTEVLTHVISGLSPGIYLIGMCTQGDHNVSFGLGSMSAVVAETPSGPVKH